MYNDETTSFTSVFLVRKQDMKNQVKRSMKVIIQVYKVRGAKDSVFALKSCSEWVPSSYCNTKVGIGGDKTTGSFGWGFTTGFLFFTAATSVRTKKKVVPRWVEIDPFSTSWRDQCFDEIVRVC
jgi:hypothetical protein